MRLESTFLFFTPVALSQHPPFLHEFRDDDRVRKNLLDTYSNVVLTSFPLIDTPFQFISLTLVAQRHATQSWCFFFRAPCPCGPDLPKLSRLTIRGRIWTG